MKTLSRKTRSDITIGNLEKKLGLVPGSIRNPDGTDARSDKKLSTLRNELEDFKKKNIAELKKIHNKRMKSLCNKQYS